MSRRSTALRKTAASAAGLCIAPFTPWLVTWISRAALCDERQCRGDEMPFLAVAAIGSVVGTFVVTALFARTLYRGSESLSPGLELGAQAAAIFAVVAAPIVALVVLRQAVLGLVGGFA